MGDTLILLCEISALKIISNVNLLQYKITMPTVPTCIFHYQDGLRSHTKEQVKSHAKEQNKYSNKDYDMARLFVLVLTGLYSSPLSLRNLSACCGSYPATSVKRNLSIKKHKVM